MPVAVMLLAPMAAGTVTGENTDTLPPGCHEIRGQDELVVHGGKHFAKQFPGTIFTYDERTYHFKPCTRVTVTFVNNDTVRHQWMVHGLPTNIHEMGMFNIEVTGPGNDTGTFITPAEPETLMVHCGVPQHEQKGMKAQVKVGGGTGDLAGIPGISGKIDPFQYPRENPLPLSTFMLMVGALAGVVIAYTAPHRRLQAWLAEEHDIHVTFGRFGVDIRTGPVDRDVTEPDERGGTDAASDREPDEDDQTDTSSDEAEQTGDGADTAGTDGWLDEEDDSEVGNW